MNDILAVMKELGDTILKPQYRGTSFPAGHCYVACESLWHTGLKNRGYKPHTLRHEGSVHWFLKHPATGHIIDPTVEQFTETPDYSKGVCRGFLTREPSNRSKMVIKQVGGKTW